MGGKINSSVNRERRPLVFRLHGQNYHKIESLFLPEGSPPKFAQLYIYDTENEVSNGIQAVSQNLDIKKLHTEVVHNLKMMLDQHNVLVKLFRMIEKILRSSVKSLRDFLMMHLSGTIDVSCHQNNLIQNELRYDRIALAEDHNKFVLNLTTEQKSVYETIMGAVEDVKSDIFFVYGYGGTGKTFIWKTLSVALRSKGKIVLTIALSGIASLLLSGDRTTHSRQILPVILKGIRQDIVLATLNSSYLWKYCKVLKLTKNMRLQSIDSDIDKDELKAFSEWISCIGDGTIGSPNDGHVMINRPDDLLINDTEDSVASVVNSTSDLNIDLIGDLHISKFLNAIKCSEVPNHHLKLMVGFPIILLRNVDHYSGLCNGTRLVITRLGNNVLEGKVISESNAGFKVFYSKNDFNFIGPKVAF
ncbi:uncharacterized protein LOC125421000 [Ziziphus jujuba]|uniref:ATP-dependent DNA helicase n=1 Tax=Ziziphus jujuba TaxID=326968 RepID=A0ABM3IAW9_ZIZJJ|nr:uncharacterized protein LOC125421000 [Ziziphus jujuba]